MTELKSLAWRRSEVWVMLRRSNHTASGRAISNTTTSKLRSRPRGLVPGDGSFFMVRIPCWQDHSRLAAASFRLVRAREPKPDGSGPGHNQKQAADGDLRQINPEPVNVK